jgi:hypothetical protein
MKYILRIVSIAVPLVCGADVAMAFVPGVPHPDSLFRGNPQVAPTSPSQGSQPKQKSKRSGSRSGPKSENR